MVGDCWLSSNAVIHFLAWVGLGKNIADSCCWPVGSDAETAIQLDPNYAKAHYRARVAYKMVENYPMAKECFSNALKLDPGNKEIRAAFDEAVSEEFKQFGV